MEKVSVQAIYYVFNTLWRGLGQTTALDVDSIAYSIGWSRAYTRKVLEDMYKLGLVYTVPERQEYIEEEIPILWTLTKDGIELADKVFKDIKHWREIIIDYLKAKGVEHE
jgi:DNA-binding MarR family transcriptional regulator